MKYFYKPLLVNTKLYFNKTLADINLAFLFTQNTNEKLIILVVFNHLGQL